MQQIRIQTNKVRMWTSTGLRCIHTRSRLLLGEGGTHVELERARYPWQPPGGPLSERRPPGSRPPALILEDQMIHTETPESFSECILGESREFLLRVSEFFLQVRFAFTYISFPISSLMLLQAFLLPHLPIIPGCCWILFG